MLALSAQLGIDGLTIESEPCGPISKRLRLALRFNQDDGAPLASQRTTLRSLLVSSGHHPDTSTEKAKISLNRLRATQIREINRETGWDRVCNLISVVFNHKTGEVYVATNPRLTSAVFQGQHIKVSLFERNALTSEVSKILHCWLCSNIRLGHSLGNGRGAHIDTLAPHVWGNAAWAAMEPYVKSKKRANLREALTEIAESTGSVSGTPGWIVDHTPNGLVFISRPKDLPIQGMLQSRIE